MYTSISITKTTAGLRDQKITKVMVIQKNHTSGIKNQAVINNEQRSQKAMIKITVAIVVVEHMSSE